MYDEYGYERHPSWWRPSVLDPAENIEHRMRQEELAMPWHENYYNVTALGRWLLRERQFTAAELQSYYEKPWKWDDEYREMEAATA